MFPTTPQEVELLLPPALAYDEYARYEALLAAAGLAPGQADFVHLRKRSVDARGRQPLVRLRADIYRAAPPAELFGPWFTYPNMSRARRTVLIVGAGPAGLFAALRCIELGIRPIVVERGKDVRARRRDLAALNKEQVVNPDSNYCFGEGGAGTYSDGKLYTRATKRGDVQRILRLLVQHGATPDILVDAHPHIGTNKLPAVVAALRDAVRAAGGEVRFETRVEELLLTDNHLRGVVTATGAELTADAVILATGHSARDIYQLLHRRGVLIEAKPFALGVRVEHPQALIDQAQYGRPDRGPLPAASYALVHQTQGAGGQRGVFSFCMCPGGFIVPAATAPGEVVVNGMSPSRRDSRFANSGIVAAVELADMDLRQHGPLAGLQLQQEIEQRACQLGGHGQVAPAQLLGDFLQAKDLPRAAAYFLPARPAGGADGRGAGPPAGRAPAPGLPKLRPQDSRLRHQRRPNRGRGEPHLLPRPHPPRPGLRCSTRGCAACSRAARARATPAASSRPRWTASGARKR